MEGFAHLRARPRGASGEGGSVADPREKEEAGEPAEPRSPGLPSIAALATTSLILYAALTALGDLKQRIPLFLMVYGVLFALYALSLPLWWRVRRGRLLWVGLACAVLFRLALLPATPSLSDDIHRYLWEGRVVRSGASPFLHAPADPALAGLRDGGWSRVAHAEVPSVYPPVAQAFFALAGLAGLAGGPGAALLGLKGALVLTDLVALGLLAHVLVRLGLPPGRAMVYGWSPLVVVEVAGSGHLEPLAVVPALVALVALTGSRRVLAGAWTGLAAAGRLLHGSFGLCWARRLGPAGLLALVLVTLVLWAPFLQPGVLDGLSRYAGSWEYNGAVFPGVRAGLEWLEPTPRLKDSITFLRRTLGEVPGLHGAYFYTDVPTLARGTMVLGFLAWTAWLGLRRAAPLRAGYLTVGAFVLLSPTLHPWYLVQIVPFLAFFPAPGWILLTGTVALSYLSVLTEPSWQVGGGLWALEFLPPLAVQVAAWISVSGRGGLPGAGVEVPAP